MMNESMYEKLIEALNDRKNTFLLTITSHPEKQLIGAKALIWPDEDFYTEDPISLILNKILIEKCEKLIKKIGPEVAQGLAFGFISYTVLKLLTGKRNQIQWIMYFVSIAFIINFIMGGH
ncbi:hypothetical protein ACFVSW_14465 [Neobacillus sp. NPDC058068]|uniref:hypothetical protein n=1 Tax=Neobacillus sp. NPDC058068 TaxID=3346325 RepID=UPI0036DD1E37